MHLTLPLPEKPQTYDWWRKHSRCPNEKPIADWYFDGAVRAIADAFFGSCLPVDDGIVSDGKRRYYRTRLELLTGETHLFDVRCDFVDPSGGPDQRRMARAKLLLEQLEDLEEAT